MRVSVLFVGLLVGMGCASSSSTQDASSGPDRSRKEVVIAEDEALVESCSFLTEIQVEPLYSRLSKEYPEMNFATRHQMQRELRRRAARAGADAVVPTDFDDGTLHGKMYDCPETANSGDGARRGLDEDTNFGADVGNRGGGE